MDAVEEVPAGNVFQSEVDDARGIESGSPAENAEDNENELSEGDQHSVRDWISVHEAAPALECLCISEDDSASCIKEAEGTKGEFELREWVAVHDDSDMTSRSSSPSMLEWVTVDMPSKDKASSTREDEELLIFRQSFITFSKLEAGANKAEIVPKAARKRRTISGKLRARIEAFENRFRQDVERSPLTKAKSRRFNDERGRASKTKNSEIEPGSPLEQEEEEVEEGEEATEAADSKGREQCGDEAFEHVAAQGDDSIVSADDAATQAQDSDDEWEEAKTPSQADNLVKACFPEMEIVKSTNTLRDEGHAAAAAAAAAGGLLKQVISGAALLAGLIFLWPRGNNFIRRVPQEKQSYRVVKESHRGALTPRGDGSMVLNLERFKG